MGEILDEPDAAPDEADRLRPPPWRDRPTGTAVGCWLVRGGRSGEEAIATIAELRGDAFSPWRPGSSTLFVRAWED